MTATQKSDELHNTLEWEKDLQSLMLGFCSIALCQLSMQTEFLATLHRLRTNLEVS